MQLLIGGATLSIAQMGPDFLFIDEPIEHPPGEATIVFAVEGSDEERWQVWLPEGLAAGRERVVIAKAG
jgi:hypothetical protein